MVSTTLIFLFGLFVTSLVLGAYVFTLLHFRRVRAEMKQGYGEHVAPSGTARGRMNAPANG